MDSLELEEHWVQICAFTRSEWRMEELVHIIEIEVIDVVSGEPVHLWLLPRSSYQATGESNR